MNSKTVLYVEDEDMDAFFMKRAFDFLGASYCLRVVRDGLDAMDYLGGTGRFTDRQRYPLPSLVLLDLNIPGKKGLEVLEWIRQQKQFQSLPVVIFTASDLEGDRRKNMEAGANDYVVKPNDMTKIPEILSSILKRFLNVEASERKVA